MRHFVLYRREDETGVSGTGVVAEGVMFDSGLIAVSWLTERTSIAVYRSMDDVRAIHGHGGNTEVVELADMPPSKAETIASALRRAGELGALKRSGR